MPYGLLSNGSGTATGGGGLLNSINSPDWGSFVRALSASLASSPRDNPMQGFGSAMQHETAQSGKRKELEGGRRAMKAALIHAGIPEAAAESMAQNPQAASLALQDQNRDRSEKRIQDNSNRSHSLERERFDHAVEQGKKPTWRKFKDAYGNETEELVGQDGRRVPQADYMSGGQNPIARVPTNLPPPSGPGTAEAVTAGDPPTPGGGIPPAPPNAHKETWSREQTKLAVERGQPKPIPQELAGRLALTEEYLKNAPDIEKYIKEENMTGPIDSSLAVNRVGRRGEVYRQIESGVDALVRSLTGAGMPISEAVPYAARYKPEFTDTAPTLLSKHKQLTNELTRYRDIAMQGRGGTPAASAPGAAGAPSREEALEELRRRGRL